MSVDVDRITLILLKEDGSREKHFVRSWVGIPRKTELMWIDEEPYSVVEVEYLVQKGLFGGLSVEAAGVYIRRLSEEEKRQVQKRLSHADAPPGPEPTRL